MPTEHNPLAARNPLGIQDHPLMAEVNATNSQTLRRNQSEVLNDNLPLGNNLEDDKVIHYGVNFLREEDGHIRPINLNSDRSLAFSHSSDLSHYCHLCTRTYNKRRNPDEPFRGMVYIDEQPSINPKPHLAEFGRFGDMPYMTSTAMFVIHAGLHVTRDNEIYVYKKYGPEMIIWHKRGADICHLCATGEK